MTAIFRRFPGTRVILIFLLSLVINPVRSQLKENWQPGMEIIIYHGGGMVPESFTVMISQSSSYFLHRQSSKTDSLSFAVSQKELDTLLGQVRNSHFLNMESGESKNIIYDRPTTSIELKWEDYMHKVAIGATEEIKNGLPIDFNRLWGYIMRLAMKKTGQGGDD